MYLNVVNFYDSFICFSRKVGFALHSDRRHAVTNPDPNTPGGYLKQLGETMSIMNLGEGNNISTS